MQFRINIPDGQGTTRDQNSLVLAAVMGTCGSSDGVHLAMRD